MNIIEMILYASNQSIRLEMGSEVDLFFNYNLELNECAFLVIKEQQSLNSTFN